MGIKIDTIIDLLNFYKALGFKEIPNDFLKSLLKNSHAKSVKTESLLNSTVNIQSKKNNENLSKISIYNDDFSVSFGHEKNSAIEKLNQEIKECKKCPLSNSRKNPVCGQGNINAKLIFIGEAPGIDEDLQGIPFVGEAGKLLTSLIEKMGFNRQDVYITNTVKCHPPGNREPFESEIEICFDYLKREIEIVSPKVIMTLGKVATYALMEMKSKLKEIKISKIRGNVFFYRKIPVIPTFHPAYLLRNRKDKWLTWEDAQEALRRLK